MKFLSKYKDHTIVMKQAINSFINGKQYRESGKYIEFKNGAYDTNDQEEIEFLKSKPYFGTEIWEEKTAESIKKEAIAEIAKAVGIEEGEKPSLKCEKCGFVAKSKLGLIAHQRKCNAV